MTNQSHILHIETATPVCAVAVATGDSVLAVREVDEPNIHASRLTLLINEVMEEANLKFPDLSAVAVSKGPGSYTGLRIGVSTAKGLCFALDIPLIAVHTLDAMAHAFALQYPDFCTENALLMPMIDARRMEVYSATYDHALGSVRGVAANIIDANSFDEFDPHQQVYLFGSGADKFADLFKENPAVTVVPDFKNAAAYLANLAYQAYVAEDFEDVAYFEPFYLKEFVATTPRKRD